MHYDLAILGAGAAGLLAAVTAAEILASATPPGAAPRAIALFEKNSRPGIKVLVCGGGRCNFTNAGSTDFLIAQFGRNGRFLTPALRHLDNQALRDYFARLDVPSHVEHDGKVYPDSNQARSIVDALVTRIRELNVQILTGPAGTITRLQGAPNPTTEDTETTETPTNKKQNVVSVPSVSSVVNFAFSTADGTTHTATALILALGGMSYQRMGTVGDGYRFAAALGHTIVTPRPAIVGLLASDPWIKDLQGLAVRDIEVTITPPQGSRLKTHTSSGDMLFTHFGLSGPAILNPSEIVAQLLETTPTVQLHVDFIPHTSHDLAHATFRQWQQTHAKKRLRTLLAQSTPEVLITATSPDQTAIEGTRSVSEGSSPGTRGVSEGRPPSLETRNPKLETPLSIPARLAIKLLELENINPDQPAAILSSPQIHRLVQRLKHCPFTITATRGFQEAMVTAGGISLAEVNPHTLDSKIVPNLFLTGEVLDLTGPSGGYNLQLAFSTAHLAATTIATRLAQQYP